MIPESVGERWGMFMIAFPSHSPFYSYPYLKGELLQDVLQYPIYGAILVTDHTVVAYRQKHIPQALVGMTQAATKIHVQ